MSRIGLLAAVSLTIFAMGCHKKDDSASKAAASASVFAATTPGASSTAPVANNSDKPFEGEITVTVKDESNQKLPASITYDIKGDKIRYSPTATTVHATFDVAAQHAYAIDDAQKTYRDLDTKPATMDAKATAAAMATDAKVAKTTKTEKIAGIDCENWTIDSGDEKADVCVTKNTTYFDLARDPKAGHVEPPWAAALTKEKAFPLRVVVHDKAGKEQFRVDATKVDRKKIDDTVFALPTGFKKADLDVRSASLP